MLRNRRDLAIVGGGTAGLAAAVYAGRNGLDTVVYERLGLGGQMINIDRIENFIGMPEPISGYELAPRLAEQAMAAGAVIDNREVMGLTRKDRLWHLVLDGGEEVVAGAVIYAAGSQLGRLGVPGEEELNGSGVSYCATCDGEFFHGRDVAVIGGGDSALDEALYLAEIASTVTVVHRGPELTGTPVTRQRLAGRDNVRVLGNREVTQVVGDGAVSGIRVAADAGSVEDLDVAGVFIYVGLVPQTSLLEGVVSVDRFGHVPVDQGMATAALGLFAAGDVRQHSARQFATAAGDGVTAALAACEYLRLRRNDGED